MATDSCWGDNKVIKSKRCSLERVEKFISQKYFQDINLYSRLYPKKSDISEILHCAVQGRVKFEHAVSGTFSTAEVGDSFGPSWSTHWFKVKATIPEDWSDEEVRFRWNSNSEAMVWKDGRPVVGLSGDERTDYVLTRKSIPGSTFVFYIEMACNGMFGAGEGSIINPPCPTKQFKLSMAEIVVFDRDCYNLIIDLTTLIGMAKHLPDENQRGAQALYAANHIVNMCQVADCESVKRCHEYAEKFLTQRNGESQHVIHAMGHCHIDSAWLWPYAETIRKCARSWSSSVELMKNYPNFTFTCSQAQQFQWVKQYYPELYDEIKKYVKSGNFIPVGGVWVEMDGNLPSGESFVRQFLLGQRFFKEEFGSVCQEFWLPDTFGYSAQLPQIMRGCGIRYFVTQKLSWNLINKFPHSSFIWEGIDGSKCLVHFPPGETYESQGGVDDIVKTVNNSKDKGRTNVSMLLFGYGDGGGGPTEDMIEKLQRIKNTDGLPRVELSTPQTFFESLDKNSSSNLCTWVGELYLELHQGTFTVEAQIKDGNRRCERLLHDVEFLSTVVLVANRRTKCAYDYPAEELDRLWKLLLLNQFHDVLPGSCISDVVKDALEYYQDIKRSGSKLLAEAARGLGNKEATGQQDDRTVILNSLSWPRKRILNVPNSLLENHPTSVVSQYLTADESVVLTEMPSMGYTALESGGDRLIKPCSIEYSNGSSNVLFQNEYLSAEVDHAGRIVSLMNKENKRNIISPGCCGNQFVLFDNMPLYWDAWDVMPYHLETRKPVSEVQGDAKLRILETGPLRVSAEFSLKISETSWIIQVISLDAVSPFLVFNTRVNWYENRKFLKVEFPVDIHAAQATYEIQFGHLQRPTHFNTSWDWARYEVCCQKWCDLSEYNWGCSILNDNKYGCSIHGNVMNISLLRSPKAPDDKADMGRHEFKYAVFPHTGTFQDSKVIQYSYEFNSADHLIKVDPKSEKVVSFFQVTNPAIILETVKMAEDGDCMILRAYEAYGGHQTTRITSTFNITKCYRCDLLERDEVQLEWLEGVQLKFKPFEVITLKCSCQ